MALIDDDVAEVVGWVVGLQEVRVRVVAVDIEGLVGRDQDARVLLGVGSRNGGGVSPEGVLERGQALVAELLAIAQEERAPELAGVSDPPQEVDRDERLAGPGGEAEEGSRFAAGELLEDGPDGGILVVASGGLAAFIGRDERPR